jgi:uncharacterized protein YbjT (DUF2867 family)
MKLVVGATGVLGGEITRRLIQSGERVRALVRPQSKTGALRDWELSWSLETSVTPLA